MKDILIYCNSCGKDQPLLIEPMTKDLFNGEKIWGDLVCPKCYLIIATLTVPEDGIYEFVRVGQ